MQPKVNDRGAKSINIISTQTNRSLHISTPLLMTWGIADFVDEKGESDGKFSMSLNFPNDDYSTPATKELLQKLKAFEEQILNDAVKNSEAWFGEEMSKEVVKHTFFPFLKYTKDKITKKTDFSKPPSIRAKVPNYNGKWNVEIYDTKGALIFPCDNENLTPMDFVPKQSNVACVLQCGGLWFGGKGFGVTWKLNQCVVKPRENLSVYGKCYIELSNDDIEKIETQELPVIAEDETEEGVSSIPAVISTNVEDSDNEEQPPKEETKPVVKKVIKKAAVVEEVVEKQVTEPVVVVDETPSVETVASAEPVVAATAVKKKIIKKKV
jgi:hypothetical protein